MAGKFLDWQSHHQSPGNSMWLCASGNCFLGGEDLACTCASAVFDSNCTQILSVQGRDVSAALFPRLADWLLSSPRLGRLCKLPMHCLGDMVLFRGGPVNLVCSAFSGRGGDQAKYSPSGTEVVMSSSGRRWLNWKRRRSTSAYHLVVQGCGRLWGFCFFSSQNSYTKSKKSVKGHTFHTFIVVYT